MKFNDPLFLFFIPLFFCTILFFKIRKKKSNIVILSSSYGFKGHRFSFKAFIVSMIIYLRVIAFVLIVIAASRPYLQGTDDIKREGIAIMLVMDCSSTMLAEDLEISSKGLVSLTGLNKNKRLNRLESLKKVARVFVESRKNDMIGVVAFAAQAYIVCPPTFDKKWINNTLDRLDIGLIKDATAIGSGILTGLNALKGVDAKEKIIVLMTDGINNFGRIPPIVASKAARSLGIKIYTIGIANKGQTPFPTIDMYGKKKYKNVRIEIDAEVLEEIAKITGGEFFRVSSIQQLHKSFKAIDSLQTTKLVEQKHLQSNDVFMHFLYISLCLLFIESFLRYLVVRRIP